MYVDTGERGGGGRGYHTCWHDTHTDTPSSHASYVGHSTLLTLSLFHNCSLCAKLFFPMPPLQAHFMFFFSERKKERKKVYLSSSRNKHGYKDNNRHVSMFILTWHLTLLSKYTSTQRVSGSRLICWSTYTVYY
jgi:hypothetical protein